MKRVSSLSLVFAVIDFEVLRGHLRWKISDLARHSKVSRTLVYYHLGRTKADIVAASVRILGELYCGLNIERVEMLKCGKILDSILHARQVLARSPSSVVFYQQWRSRKGSSLQKILIDLETRYEAKLKEVFPNLSPSEIAAIQAIFHGLTTSPILDEKSIKVALNWFNPVLSVVRK